MVQLLLYLALQSGCEFDCPTAKAHAQSKEHAAGGACKGCTNKGIDVCYRLCRACALKTGGCQGCGGRTVTPEKTWTGNESKLDKADYARVTTKDDWTALWKRHSDAGAPEVDFEKFIVVAILGGETRGAPVIPGRVREFEDRLEIRFAQYSPMCGNEPTLRSFAFLVVARSPKRLEIIKLQYQPVMTGPPAPEKVASFDPVK